MLPLKSCHLYMDCGLCVTTEHPHGCGWCGDHCSTAADCGDGGAFRTDTCPPRIRTFSPTSGPLVGGTLITIHGDDFGLLFANISVLLGDSVCNIVKWSMQTITCISTRPRGMPESTTPDLERALVVTVDDRNPYEDRQYRIEGRHQSLVTFRYAGVRFESFSPRFGPMAGRTRLTLSGQHLDVGTHRGIKVAGIQCDIYRRVSICGGGLCLGAELNAKIDVPLESIQQTLV
ncbi:PREDICTED: hepatocyte growth factor receptor-like [Priapulus caudatus]|uniref:Hepatocyte growth factor receptor-like n=1 Tax=Priapulus caudatus TaxID=37621 RepID=A0ABM1F2Q9_PRICU|nr:PREDICTED: hepatocyte growth factor receptor-like [Priapulus caudatus]